MRAAVLLGVWSSALGMHVSIYFSMYTQPLFMDQRPGECVCGGGGGGLLGGLGS
jgi:hypothetical protein